jgi:hypothetical protein
VVTTDVLIDVRGAAELGGEHDEGILEETAIMEVAQEGGEPLVEGFAALRHGDEVGIVGVPTAEGDFDKAHAALNEATGEEATLTEGLAASSVRSKALRSSDFIMAMASSYMSA